MHFGVVKQVVWLGSSPEAVQGWTAEAQRDTGYQLFKVQLGMEPSDSKPMPSVGRGVREIRIHCGNEYRIIYLATLAEAVYVLQPLRRKCKRSRTLRSRLHNDGFSCS